MAKTEMGKGITLGKGIALEKGIAQRSRRGFPGRGFLKEVRKNHALFVMSLPALAFLAIFSYIPMYGTQIAFRQFNVVDGITR
ncbi:MAG: hypothetical protein LBL83_08660, partial [Clostridiales bacterium]|nr:hypothetical protein [Clostridiales bacterium]